MNQLAVVVMICDVLMWLKMMICDVLLASCDVMINCEKALQVV